MCDMHGVCYENDKYKSHANTCWNILITIIRLQNGIVQLPVHSEMPNRQKPKNLIYIPFR